MSWSLERTVIFTDKRVFLEIISGECVQDMMIFQEEWNER